MTLEWRAHGDSSSVSVGYWTDVDGATVVYPTVSWPFFCFFFNLYFGCLVFYPVGSRYSMELPLRHCCFPLMLVVSFIEINFLLVQLSGTCSLIWIRVWIGFGFAHSFRLMLIEELWYGGREGEVWKTGKSVWALDKHRVGTNIRLADYQLWLL